MKYLADYELKNFGDTEKATREMLRDLAETIEKQEDRIKEQQVQINELKNDRIDDIQRNCDPLT